MGNIFLMYVYRITHKSHATDLTGEGARINGGRWNSIGKRLLYTSQSVSLCLCECLVHFPSDNPPINMVKLTIEIPDDGISNQFKNYDFNINPNPYIDGDNWINSNSNLAVIVPSFVVKTEYNILINPNHPRMNDVKILNHEDFDYDFRLFN